MDKRLAIIASIAAFATLGLVGCSTMIPTTGSSTSASPSASESTEPESPEPTPTLTPKQTDEPVEPIETQKPQGLPDSCEDLGTAETRATTIDLVTYYPDAEVPVMIPIDEMLVSCYWFAGDVTGMDLAIAAVQEQDAVALLEEAAASGYTCGADNGYSQCRLDEEADYYDNKYPVTTFFLYGSGVWIEATASNLDATDFMTAIAESIWQ